MEAGDNTKKRDMLTKTSKFFTCGLDPVVRYRVYPLSQEARS